MLIGPTELLPLVARLADELKLDLMSELFTERELQEIEFVAIHVRSANGLDVPANPACAIIAK